jgi:hypothetical protein
VSDLGATKLKNIAEPVHVYSLQVGEPGLTKPSKRATSKQLSILALLLGGVLAVAMIATGPGDEASGQRKGLPKEIRRRPSALGYARTRSYFGRGHQ